MSELISELLKERMILPPRILLYSSPGWGKSTFAASMPNPIFLDCEDGLSGLTVNSFPTIEKFDDLIKYLNLLIMEKHDYKTIVLDSVSSIERLILSHLCKIHNKKSIASWGYGEGYSLALNLWYDIMQILDKIRKQKITIMLLGHAEVKTISPPNVDPYDKYVITIYNKTAYALSQWTDIVLFGDHRVYTADTSQGAKKVSKGIGQGIRIIYTDERPAFFAKSRPNINFEIEIPEVDGWKTFKQNIK
jgi:hypothetical protein